MYNGGRLLGTLAPKINSSIMAPHVTPAKVLTHITLPQSTRLIGDGYNIVPLVKIHEKICKHQAIFSLQMEESSHTFYSPVSGTVVARLEGAAYFGSTLCSIHLSVDGDTRFYNTVQMLEAE